MLADDTDQVTGGGMERKNRYAWSGRSGAGKMKEIRVSEMKKTFWTRRQTESACLSNNVKAAEPCRLVRNVHRLVFRYGAFEFYLAVENRDLSGHVNVVPAHNVGHLHVQRHCIRQATGGRMVIAI